MNWKLILQLSTFGLVMGLATISIIPSSLEPAFWLVIFLVCAYIIAKQSPGKPFLHGLLLGLANSIWITASHIIFFDRYLANHAREAQMVSSMPVTLSPKILMGITGPVVGLISGAAIGILAMLATRLLKAQRA